MKLFSKLFLGLTLAAGLMLTGCGGGDTGTGDGKDKDKDKGSSKASSLNTGNDNMTAAVTGDATDGMTLVSLKLPAMT